MRTSAVKAFGRAGPSLGLSRPGHRSHSRCDRDGQIALGEPLRERQLAEELDISRAPIRRRCSPSKRKASSSRPRTRGRSPRTPTRTSSKIYTLRAALEELAVTRLGGHVTAADLRALDEF